MASSNGHADSSSDNSIFDYLMKIVPLLPIVGVATGMLVFLGRLYLESYYGYFGIPSSALTFEVHDYTFGSFPLVIFVFVILVSHFLYNQAIKNADPAARIAKLVREVFSGLSSRSIRSKESIQRRRKAYGIIRRSRELELIMRRDESITTGRVSDGLETIRRFSILNGLALRIVAPGLIGNGLIYLIGYIFFYSFIGLTGVAYILVVIGMLGTQFASAELGIHWEPPNIPGFRGLFSGIFVAFGALMFIVLIELLLSLKGGKPKELTNAEKVLAGLEPSMASTDSSAEVKKARAIRSFYIQILTVLIVLVAMPTATHFMARDQAQSDLQTPPHRFQSRLALAQIVMPKPNVVATGWEWSCPEQNVGIVEPTASAETVTTATEATGSTVAMETEKLTEYCSSPPVRIVAVNEGIVYALEDSAAIDFPAPVHTVRVDENVRIVYRSQLRGVPEVISQ